MCHVCVIEGVKAEVTRRTMLAGAIAAGAGGPALSPGRARAQSEAQPVSFTRVVDLTHTLTPDFPTFDGSPAFTTEDLFTYEVDKLNMKILRYAEHIGTHFDAPIHFSTDGATIDQIPIEDLVCPLVIIDVREAVSANPDYRLSPDDIAAFEARYGEIPENACVAMLSGWEEKLVSGGFRGEDANGESHFPGFDVETARFLIRERSVNGIAVDTLTLDAAQVSTNDVHDTWLPSGRFGIECVANLAELPPIGATLIGGAPKFQGSTGDRVESWRSFSLSAAMAR